MSPNTEKKIVPVASLASKTYCGTIVGEDGRDFLISVDNEEVQIRFPIHMFNAGVSSAGEVGNRVTFRTFGGMIDEIDYTGKIL